MLESIPPDRKTPTGTSLTVRSATLVRNSASRRSAISPSNAGQWRGVIKHVPVSFFRRCPSGSMARNEPGGSLWIPANSVAGAGVVMKDK